MIRTSSSSTCRTRTPRRCPRVRPRSRVKLTPSTALTVTLRIPIRTGMCTSRSVTSRTRSLAPSDEVTSCGVCVVSAVMARPRPCRRVRGPRGCPAPGRGDRPRCAAGRPPATAGPWSGRPPGPRTRCSAARTGSRRRTSSRSGGRPAMVNSRSVRGPQPGRSPDQRAGVGVPGVGEDRLAGRSTRHLVPAYMTTDVVGHLGPPRPGRGVMNRTAQARTARAAGGGGGAPGPGP